MATGPSNDKETTGDLSDIKRKLAWRMGFAGLMIIALLGGLALFDYLSAQNETETNAPQFTEPVPVPKKVVTQPVTPAEPVDEEAKAEKKEREPEVTVPPVDKSAPAVEPPSRPTVAAQPASPRASPPPAPAGKASTAVSQPVPTTPNKTTEPKAAAPSTPPVRSEPPAVATPSPSPNQALVSPSSPRLISGYALQAGVFSDPRRAEELHAKLTLEGIPSTLETRVQVGPFKSRDEAEAAKAKMKALGIDAVMLFPKGGKR